jgi:hypothetical protein
MLVASIFFTTDSITATQVGAQQRIVSLEQGADLRLHDEERA